MSSLILLVGQEAYVRRKLTASQNCTSGQQMDVLISHSVHYSHTWLSLVSDTWIRFSQTRYLPRRNWLISAATAFWRKPSVDLWEDYRYIEMSTRGCHKSPCRESSLCAHLTVTSDYHFLLWNLNTICQSVILLPWCQTKPLDIIVNGFLLLNFFFPQNFFTVQIPRHSDFGCSNVNFLHNYWYGAVYWICAEGWYDKRCFCYSNVQKIKTEKSKYNHWENGSLGNPGSLF